MPGWNTRSRSTGSIANSGATLEEIENAVGPGGFMRRVLEADRDQQIAEVEKWLAGTPARTV